MNNKLNKKQRVSVEIAKISILRLQEKQDRIFNDLIEDLKTEGVVDDGDSDWIFDFIYNAGKLSDAYYQMIESKIFEENVNQV